MSEIKKGASADDQSRITEAGAVELSEDTLDQAAGGQAPDPASSAAPASLLSKAASGKF